MPAACGGPTDRVYATQEGEWFAIANLRAKSITSRLPSRRCSTCRPEKSVTSIRTRSPWSPAPPRSNSCAGRSPNLNITRSRSATRMSVARYATGMGHKFYPALLAAGQVRTSTVDSQMSAIGFLLTGYSDFYVFRSPTPTATSCRSEAGASCLNLAPLVQYVQAQHQWPQRPVDGQGERRPQRPGHLLLHLDGGYLIAVQSVGSHSLPYGKTANLLVNLGMAAAGNSLQAWFQRPTGVPMAGAFTIYRQRRRRRRPRRRRYFRHQGLQPARDRRGLSQRAGECQRRRD